MTEKFRTLYADEIDVRISTVSANGVSLLLYKDARCDMNILDETVGPLNWERRHSRENANCTVSIWDADKGAWVSKEDTGTESYTEKEKGIASDSFKRACFNWGIGRELYTAPFIWVNTKGCKVEQKDDRGKKKYTCADRFRVSKIGYDEQKKISELEIVNAKTNVCVYRMCQDQDRKINAREAEKLRNEAGRTGMHLDEVMKKKVQLRNVKR